MVDEALRPRLLRQEGTPQPGDDALAAAGTQPFHHAAGIFLVRFDVDCISEQLLLVYVFGYDVFHLRLEAVGFEDGGEEAGEGSVVGESHSGRVKIWCYARITSSARILGGGDVFVFTRKFRRGSLSR